MLSGQQTQMFWQLLRSMPVDRVGPVMQWALSSLAPEELQDIITLLQTEVPDLELQSLVKIWLAPRSEVRAQSESGFMQFNSSTVKISIRSHNNFTQF